MLVLRCTLLVLVLSCLDHSSFAQDLPPVREKGLASGYAAWRPEWLRLGKKRLKVSNGKPYCWWLRKVRRGDAIIAHRSLPCGTKVYVSVVGRTDGAWVRVGDRGPYGACARKSDIRKLQKRLSKKLTTWPSTWCQARYGKDWLWYIKRRSHWPGHYRGIADISHTARRLIGHNGWQNVTLRYWHPDRPPRTVAQVRRLVPGLALSDASVTTRHRWGQGRGAAASLSLGASGEIGHQWLSPELPHRESQAVLHRVRTLLNAVATADGSPMAW